MFRCTEWQISTCPVDCSSIVACHLKLKWPLQIPIINVPFLVWKPFLESRKSGFHSKINQYLLKCIFMFVSSCESFKKCQVWGSTLGPHFHFAVLAQNSVSCENFGMELITSRGYMACCQLVTTTVTLEYFSESFSHMVLRLQMRGTDKCIGK